MLFSLLFNQDFAWLQFTDLNLNPEVGPRVVGLLWAVPDLADGLTVDKAWLTDLGR
jgi:hypothetical protein